MTLLVIAVPARAAVSPSAKHDQDVIRFFLHHPRLADTPAGRRELWRILHRLTVQLRSLQAARAWPAHHPLWMCIHGGEGNWDDADSGHNGHYGGLQMTPGWLGLIPGTANTMSQLEQERAAELGYRNSGYSRRWLNGQWGQTIGPCWGYA